MRTRLLLVLPVVLTAHAGRRVPGPPPPQDAADTVALAVRRVASSVGEVRSGLDVLRRAASNEADTAVLARATSLRLACEAMSNTIAAQVPMLCRHCLEQARQQPVDAYRAYLPTLQHAGRHCAATIAELRGQGAPAPAASRLRRQAVPIGEQLVPIIATYEQRLSAVRVALGWAPPPAPPASAAPARPRG